MRRRFKLQQGASVLPKNLHLDSHSTSVKTPAISAKSLVQQFQQGMKMNCFCSQVSQQSFCQQPDDSIGSASDLMARMMNDTPIHPTIFYDPMHQPKVSSSQSQPSRRMINHNESLVLSSDADIFDDSDIASVVSCPPRKQINRERNDQSQESRITDSNDNRKHKCPQYSRNDNVSLMLSSDSDIFDRTDDAPKCSYPSKRQHSKRSSDISSNISVQSKRSIKYKMKNFQE